MIRTCDYCDATVFPDEDCCALCGCKELSDSKIPPMAERLLLRFRGGEPVREAVKAECRRLARDLVQRVVRQLVEEVTTSAGLLEEGPPHVDPNSRTDPGDCAATDRGP